MASSTSSARTAAATSITRSSGSTPRPPFRIRRPPPLALNNQVNSIAENTSTAARIKVADVVVTDDGLGTNNLTVTGADAGFFEVDSTGLFIKAGTTLDFETKTSYSVTVEVDDPTVGGTPDATAAFTPCGHRRGRRRPRRPSLVISEVAPWASGNSPVCRRLVRGDEHRRQRREHHRLEDGRQLELLRAPRWP